jgi:fatty acid desaturase
MLVEQVEDDASAAIRAREAPFPEQAKKLSVVDGRRTVAILAVQWLCILALVGLADRTGAGPLHWLVVIFAVIAVASRQQALSVLMHEAAHYRLFLNRALNDAVSDLFCALPLGLVTARYRETHLAHHLEPLGPGDPDWMIMQANPREWLWPKTPRERAWTLLRDACGLGFLAFLRQWNAWLPLTNHFGRTGFPGPLLFAIRVRIYLFYTTVAAVVLGFDLWQETLLYWFLPLATASQIMFRVRTISEHMGCGAGSGAAHTRNVGAGWAEWFLISPLNVGHHLTHHLFPGVPWFNLPELTRLLHEDIQFREVAYISSSYLSKTGLIRNEPGRAA